MTDTNTTTQVLAEVAAEREAQRRKWGTQRMPWVHVRMNPAAAVRAEIAARQRVEAHARVGNSDWRMVLAEELAEVDTAHVAGDTVMVRMELVQCAAVIVAAIESLDRGDFMTTEALAR